MQRQLSDQWRIQGFFRQTVGYTTSGCILNAGGHLLH